MYGDNVGRTVPTPETAHVTAVELLNNTAGIYNRQTIKSTHNCQSRVYEQTSRSGYLNP